MSWDIRLICSKCGNSLKVEGEEAEVNLPYCFGQLFDFPWLDGKKADYTMTILDEAVNCDLGTTRDPRDSLALTKGNVGHYVAILLKWALKHPAGIWEVL